MKAGEALNSEKSLRSATAEKVLKPLKHGSVNSIATQLFDTVNSSWTTGKNQGNKILKFISGAIWFLIVTICVPFMNTFKKRSDKLVAFIVMIILSTIVGCIFMAIPIIYRSWINYFVIPIAQLVIVIVLVGKKDKKS